MLLAVDGNSLVHRSFHALASTGMRSSLGEPMWAVRGLLTQLVAAVDRIGPAAVVVGFDDPDRSVRRARWPQYKANRGDKLASLVRQLELAVSVLTELGVHVVTPAGLEADDVLASAARHAGENGARTVIVTSDRDAFAMIDERTSVLRIINGGVDASPLLTPQRLSVMLGVDPHQYRDFAALRGDPSDNLPGVKGFGPRTAARLLAALGSVPDAFADLDAGGGRVVEAVGRSRAARLGEPASRAAWELNCQVMTMHPHVAVDLTGEVGALPLPAEAVRTTYGGQDLHWTTAAALRALARDGSGPVAPDVEPSWAPRPSRRTHPPLPPRRVSDQLALF